jgi:hypothetical protein
MMMMMMMTTTTTTMTPPPPPTTTTTTMMTTTKKAMMMKLTLSVFNKVSHFFYVIFSFPKRLVKPGQRRVQIPQETLLDFVNIVVQLCGLGLLLEKKKTHQRYKEMRIS